MISFTPMTTLGEIAEILEANKRPDFEVYMRIETIRGKVCAILMRDSRMPAQSTVEMLRRQAD